LLRVRDSEVARPIRRPLLLTLLVLGAVINYADRQTIAILKPLIGLDFHWSDAQYGRLASAFQLAAAFGLLFAGWFVDRVGIRRANPLAVGTWSLIAVAQAAARTLAGFATLRVALGAAEAMGTPVLVKSVAVLFAPSERSVAFGAMNAASTAGAIVTPLAIPLLAAAWGWRSAFVIVGSTGLLWVAAWLVAARGTAELGASAEPPSSAARPTWGEALRDRRTWAIAGGKLFSDQVWWFLLFWAPDVLRLHGLDVLQTAVPLATIYSCAAVGSLLGGFASRALIRRGMALNRARKMTLLGCAILAVPVASVPVLRGEWATVAVLGLTLAAHQGFSVNLFALIADIIPPSRVATVTGFGAFCGNLGGMGILAFTAWILTRRGDYGLVFAFASVSYLLALVWIHLWVPVLRIPRVAKR
jgi:ACS family hexuronate transporter-like MFS transporter